MRVSGESSRGEHLAFDPVTRRLTVGERSTIVPVTSDRNEAMLRGYLALVAEARGTAIGSLTELRQDDIAVLVELLDLDDADLELRFVRLLGMSASNAAETRRRLVKHRAMLATAGLSVGLFVTAGAAAAATATPASSVAPVVVSVAADAASQGVTTPATADAQDPATQASRQSSPRSTPESTPQFGDVEIGDAMVIERGTPPDDPNVQIGDTVTYEK